jgi:hypothetical protein
LHHMFSTVMDVEFGLNDTLRLVPTHAEGQ